MNHDSIPIKIERRDFAQLITIDRPERRNAITYDISVAIADALDELDADGDLRVGIITGAGGCFCSGMDLKDFASGRRPELEGRGFAGVTERPPVKPLIAAVEGFALAGGFELALACDMIVAGEGAVFGLPEVARGLVAGSGGLVRMGRRIPEGIALEYALTGARMSAQEAARWGLVNRLVPAGSALDEALSLAQTISANAPLSVAASKHILHAARNWAEAEVWDWQRPLADAVIQSEDAIEGARAFAEKRVPVWRGR
ncbi:MAG: enoyl-CoA hydratase [Rhizobiaceae bacterium]|nr:enoyl-CoA hydratase [Rhizobiaceae bacterium]|tara:strand:+ start:3666 stop:4439 length:774 start_codon:yes stop_codon:yes gene_type:complete